MNYRTDGGLLPETAAQREERRRQHKQDVAEMRAQELLRGTAAAVEYQLRTVLDAVNHVHNVGFLRSPLKDALKALTEGRSRV